MVIDHSFKTIVIGDSMVGKTTMLHQLVDKKFKNTVKITIGIDLISKTFDIITTDRIINCRLNIWDVSGLDNYKTIIQPYFNNIDGIIFVFDVNNYKSFKSIQKWYNIYNIYKKPYNLPKMLIGNKIDNIQNRKFVYSEIIEYAKKMNMVYIELSSKDYASIYQTFNTHVYNIYYSKRTKNIKNDRNSDSDGCNIT